MSFSSRSSNGKHNNNGHNGSNHYQKKGFFGKLLNMVGSNSGSQGNYNNRENNNPPTPNQNTIICSKCNSRVPVGSKFCLQCGEKVSVVAACTNCGEKLPPNANFCLKCGNKMGK